MTAAVGAALADPVILTIHCDQPIVRADAPLRFGVNVNHVIGSDDYDPGRPVTLRDSLRALGVKAIRWNEGESGDKMIWSIPPFTKPDLHVTHDRRPATGHYRDHIDDAGKVIRAMQLDEAIGVARDLSLELYIIVGIDAVWVDEPAVRARDQQGREAELGPVLKRMTDWPWAVEGASSRAMILDGTEALGRYLKRNADDVDVFLEIGNENYLGKALWKPEAYGEISNAVAARVRRSGSKARVGIQVSDQRPWTSVSADGRPWNEVLLEVADLSLFDFFIAHQYGKEEPYNTDAAHRAMDGLNKADAERFFFSVTETACWGGPGVSGNLPQPHNRWMRNTLAGALRQFQWMPFVFERGQGRLRTPLFWMSRWHPTSFHDDSYRATHCAIDKDGQLLAVGKAMRLWNEYVHDSLLKVTAPDDNVRRDKRDLLCFASRDRNDPSRLTLWLVNRGDEDKQVRLNLEGHSGGKMLKRLVYSGDGPDDVNPQIANADAIKLRAGVLDISAPASTINVCLFGESE